MPSTIDADTFAGDKVGLDEKEHRLGDFLGTTPSAERRGGDIFSILLWSDVGRGQNGSRHDGIDEDLGSQLKRQAFGKRRDRSFGDIVRYVALIQRAAANREPIGKIDDTAWPAPQFSAVYK